MVSGFGRYYQIATLFRDEDLGPIGSSSSRQLDLELSFPTRDDVLRGRSKGSVHGSHLSRRLAATPGPGPSARLT